MSVLTNEIQRLVQKHVTGILENISSKYNLDIEELRSLYLDGDVDFATSSTDVAEKKKRGRKKKQKDEFIEVEEYEYEGTKYLVDNQNNVYTHDVEQPILVGERLVDGTVRLFEKKN